MLSYFKTYQQNLFRKEHWYAEFWGALTLILYGLSAFGDTPNPNFEWPPDLGFTHVLPDTVWKVLIFATGILQLASLGTNSRLFRGFCAFMAGWLYGWITLNIYIYGYGLHPGLSLGIGFIGVNAFAVSRCVAGLK
ncbi:hypothetical protein [Entomobacter blattae]|uniref:Uncharacterized protein n=1 Tax=Entomobacter blattae TaxID=2762277 RepID=A0A7H1NU25_9PROT|nr:hypothetical protein [Entomobacter blattae]QNT79285.1 hypothetical protein JGUZn3_20820 [Entomobacter blattae]